MVALRNNICSRGGSKETSRELDLETHKDASRTLQHLCPGESTDLRQENSDLHNSFLPHQKYKEQCLNKKPSAVLTETCRLLETELDVFNLLLIRQRVNIEIAKEREAVPEPKQGWFSGWGWGGGAKKEDQTAGQKLGK